MELGNLVCRFGNEKVLLDLIDEIVLPAFLDEELVRTYDKTSYFFHQVRIVMLQNNDKETIVGIAGRLIKDTTLLREQIFEEGKGLVKDHGAMRSSPSSMFLLVLNNHRLIYVRETKDAPSKETFRSTLLSFLREKHKQYIDGRFEDATQKGEDSRSITKKELLEITPRPNLTLIPLTSEDSIENFIRQYDVLKSIEIALSDRNDENDNDAFFNELQRRKEAIGSASSVVKHNNPKGLDKDEAIKEVADATSQGNQSVRLNGVDKEGDILRGNNEKFQLRKPLNDLSDLPSAAANELFSSFVGLIDDGLIRVPATSHKAIGIINSLVKRLL